MKSKAGIDIMKNLNLLNKIQTWDESAARHILSRTHYGFTKSDVEFALTMSLDDYVDNHLLKDSPLPNPPGNWVNTIPDENNEDAFEERIIEFINWLFNLLTYSQDQFREKMVQFLHNHFVSKFEEVEWPSLMYRQNQLFRNYAFGNFIELTKQVNIDPAMLVFLNGEENSKEHPNENYARELLELFTIGIGNYTEKDVKEAARALTGWRFEGFDVFLEDEDYDDGQKTFMGETGNFGHTDIVDIIFKNNETAKFLCRKLYSYFVHYEPNEQFVSQLAQVMVDNNYDLKPVLSVMLKSEYFHSVDIRGAKIKSPIEFAVGSLRQFNIEEPDFEYVSEVCGFLKQRILDPPNVSGWQGQRNWISTSTLPHRNIYSDDIIYTYLDEEDDEITYGINVLEYTRTYDSSENAVQLIEDVTQNLIQFPLSQSKKDLLLKIMLDGSAEYDWSTYDPQAESRLRKLYQAIMRLPEYQLS